MARGDISLSFGRWLWIAATLAVVAWLFWNPQPNPWIQFESLEGRFSISIPEDPTAKTQSVKTAVGDIELQLYVLEHDHFSFMAGYSDYPEAIFAASTTKILLDGARDGAALNIQGSVESETQISLDGHPGRAVVMTDSTNTLLLEIRLFLVDRRLYQVGVVSRRDNRTSPEISRYLDSFDLLAPD